MLLGLVALQQLTHLLKVRNVLILQVSGRHSREKWIDHYKLALRNVSVNGVVDGKHSGLISEPQTLIEKKDIILCYMETNSVQGVHQKTASSKGEIRQNI